MASLHSNESPTNSRPPSALFQNALLTQLAASAGVPPETSPTANRFAMVNKQPIRKKEVTSRKRTLSLAANNIMDN